MIARASTFQDDAKHWILPSHVIERIQQTSTYYDRDTAWTCRYQNLKHLDFAALMKRHSKLPHQHMWFVLENMKVRYIGFNQFNGLRIMAAMGKTAHRIINSTTNSRTQRLHSFIKSTRVILVFPSKTRLPRLSLVRRPSLSKFIPLRLIPANLVFFLSFTSDYTYACSIPCGALPLVCGGSPQDRPALPTRHDKQARRNIFISTFQCVTSVRIKMSTIVIQVM